MMKQSADGSHRFDMMGAKVIKAYNNITNIIVRLSCPACHEDAILLNSHFDTTVVTPGASDDAAGVAVMIEMLRLFSQRPDIKHSVVFLFNGAEETLQDASHAFVTQHKLATSIKAVINLESMGARGREILFQANTPGMIQAYAKVPRPHASSLSNDVFRTGLLLSDTDFRQFVQYGNLSGLDFAFYQNSYQYHTLLDTEENIETGALQHLGDNIVRLMESLLVEQKSWEFVFDATVVYYDFLGLFFVHYSRDVAFWVHMAAASFATLICFLQGRALRLNAFEMAGTVVSAWVNILSGIAVTVLLSLGLASFNPMSWFSNELYPLYLFALTFAVGLCLGPIAFGKTKSFEFDRMERKSFIGFCLFFNSFLMLTTWSGISSSYLCLFHSVSLSLGMLLDLIQTRGIFRQAMSWSVYALSMLIAVPFGAATALSLLKVFVPIAGRIGTDAPVDIIVPIVSILCLLISQFYLLIPMTYRLSPQGRQNILAVFGIFALAGLSYFSTHSPYTELAPKRLFCSYMENSTSGDRGVHLAYADIGRSDEALNALTQAFNVEPVRRSVDQSDRDWSTIFPFSHFIENYYFNLTDQVPDLVDISPMLVSKSIVHPNGTRTIWLECQHEHFMWTVISFNARVNWWSLDTLPPKDFKHIIRHVSGDGGDKWSLVFNVQGTEPLDVDVSGLERDGYNHFVNNNSPTGMRWMWSDRWQSASILSKVERHLPRWTAPLLVSVVISNHLVE